MARRRHRVAAALAVLTGLAVTSCAAPAAGPPAEPGPAPVPPGLERFYGQRLAWGPCAPLATNADDRALFEDPAFDCARLEVPLDYAAPGGRTAQVAVLRNRADQPAIGSLVLNPGGPGGSGTSFAAGMSGALGGGPFDVVGFDPRGVGASTPRIDCLSDAEWDAERADADHDTSPAGVARAEDRSRREAANCVRRSGADVLAHAGTREVARDLDILRAALGDRRLTYLGFSYGTRIGAEYAERFPGNVRAMVLDGAVDPTENAVDSSVAQMAGFQQAFDAFAADCVRRPSCPLGTDPARATAEFQALTRPLIDRPAPVPGDTRTLSYSDALTAVFAAMYGSHAWPELSTGLAQLRAGDGATLLRLADQYYGRRPDGTYPDDMEALQVVNCADGDRITDRTVAAELSRRATAAAPFADAGRGTSGALDTCAFLPITPTGVAHLPHAPGLPPTLVISTTGDPATPYRAGVRLAEALHARLLTVEGAQHTAAAEGHPCVDDVVADYLVHLTLPPEGARCALTRP
ncbi:alpha/beta fold hydrolase [Pseudonocardia sp. C8]|uniref:alpha/beta hydrolase n=1 Tax=Pseudonocardia sp. C8 TaxID=2762759 RepID=UPI00164321E5|nr:alpha/beta hydrolase [Pseudonocardia sp. C8]MBC3192822.1 alpha/beta fold hydrolase [Pseudonocardia sp. C8]